MSLLHSLLNFLFKFKFNEQKISKMATGLANLTHNSLTPQVRLMIIFHNVLCYNHFSCVVLCKNMWKYV